MRFNSDRLVSISAIIVSVATLLMVLYQTHLQRTQQKASVMPYLSIGLSINNGYQALIVENKGLGPAIIESVKVKDGDQVYQGEPYGYAMKGLGTNLDSLKNVSTDLIFKGRLLASEDRLEIFSHKAEGLYANYITDTYRFNYGFKYREEEQTAPAIIEIIYSSVYGDRWVARSDETVPETLD